MKKIETSNDVKLVMLGFIASGAVNTALEKGLFWDLETPKDEVEIAKLYSIPVNRCKKWLQLLVKLGLLIQSNNTFQSSSVAKNEIINTMSRNAWEFLAQEAREKYPAIINLSQNISHYYSVWAAQNIENVDYVTKMTKDLNRAERFTRMLYEIHNKLADKIAILVDTSNMKSILDLGGGSGVVSFALMKQNPELKSTIFDISTVCQSGRKIAEEEGMNNRVSYLDGNFLEEDLPKGYDLVLYCDVGIYNKYLFRKIWDSLNPNGTFAIVSNTNEQGAWLNEPDQKPSLQSSMYSFLSSLSTNKSKEVTSKDLVKMLSSTGFQLPEVQKVEDGMILITSKKPI